MRVYKSSFTLLLPSLPFLSADFAGPTYPAPVDLTSEESFISKSWDNLTSLLDSNLNGGQNTTTDAWTVARNVTFSIGLFSLNDPAASKLQYHYTAPEVANATNGTDKVDGDSIYKMASVSKLFTVLAGLLELKEEDWNRPLTEILPGLTENDHKGDAVFDVRWDQVTPWSLAAQIAGVPRDPPQADLALSELILPDPQNALGFPPPNASALAPCGESLTFCNGEEYVETIRSQPPAFEPWTTPGYANDGFILLGLAIANITGRSMSETYLEKIFKPLNLGSTYSTPPPDENDRARCVIVDDPEIYFFDGGISAPSGGLLSTTNDLAKFGVGLLNSTLLSPVRTRKWMKPLSHTASLSFSMGAPWEILRYVSLKTGKVIDIYTKLGESGSYNGNIALIPEYNAGFSILAATTNTTIRGKVSNQVLDYITTSVVPALEDQAAAEATRNLVGTYVSTDPNLNSSVTVAFNESTVPGPKYGLSITSWISNGTDVLASPAYFSGILPKLLPSIPLAHSSTTPGSSEGQVAFQASVGPQYPSYDTAPKDQVLGPFTGQGQTNSDWQTVDAPHYSGIGLKLFVFTLDKEGKATTLSPAVMKVTLERKE